MVLKEIPIFVTVVQKGSFSGAAKALGVSKSAISMRITALEKRLGVRLLHRTTRKLSLTEAGERYHFHAARALAAAQDAEDEVSQLHGEPRGRLRISTPMSFGRLHLARLIPPFLQRFPLIKLEMVMDDRISDLVAGSFDIAIRGGQLKDSNLIARKLASFQSLVCASPAYLKAHGTPTKPADLTEHNCLLFSYSSESNLWHLSQGGETQIIEVQGNYQVNNSETLSKAVVQGLGIAHLPSFVAAAPIREGRLTRLLPDYQMQEKAMYAIYLKRDYMPAKVKAFLDFVAEHLDEALWEQ